jgi:hypothetical protein
MPSLAYRSAGAMLCFFLGLLLFLREIYLATMNLRIAPR